MTIRVGTVLYGYCGGYFGRDSYADKRIEAIGADWLVARSTGCVSTPEFFSGNPEVLEQYTNPGLEGLDNDDANLVEWMNRNPGT